MGNLLDFLVDCVDCYDEGIIFQGINTDNFVTNFCDCVKGVSLETEYTKWYAESIMNENYKENA